MSKTMLESDELHSSAQPICLSEELPVNGDHPFPMMDSADSADLVSPRKSDCHPGF